MPDSTGPQEPTGADEPLEPGEPLEPRDADELRDFDETIITRQPSGEADPTELTGPPELAQPAGEIERVEIVPAEIERVEIEQVEVEQIEVEVEPVEVEPAPLRVVPIEPYYAEFPEQDTPPALPEESAQRPRPERIKRAAVVGARVVTGAVGVLVAAAVVTAAAIIPLPSYTAAVPSLKVTPVETGQELVCAGSILALSESADTDASATTALGSVAVVSGSTTDEITTTALANSDAGSGGTAAAPQVVTADVDPASNEPLLLSGAQSQRAGTEDYFGLAASTCTVPTADTWLVGGATTTGRSTLITLSNPTEVTASVDLELFGELGAVSAPGLTEIAVAPGAQRVLSLAGFAPQLASPVVHVTSTGGLVVANLQQTTVRGIEAGGLDVVGASTAPGTTTVIPGVRIAGADTIGTRIGAAGYEDLVPILRLFVPGADAVDAQVTVQSETGETEETTFDMQLTGGVALDLPIDDLVDGNYTITIESDAPVVAGARVAAIGGETDPRTDFAWIASAAELDTAAMVSTPGDVGVALHLVNPTDEAVSVSVTAVAGSGFVGTVDAVRSVELAAQGSAYVTAEAGASYELSGFDALYASVTAAAAGGVAAFTVAPRAESSNPIEIYP